MGLVLPADEVRASSRMHTLFALAAATCTPVTACPRKVSSPGTIVKSSLDPNGRARSTPIFSVVPVTRTVHSFDRVKNAPGRVDAEHLVTKRIGRSRQGLRTICDGLVLTRKVSRAVILSSFLGNLCSRSEPNPQAKEGSNVSLYCY